MSKLLIFKVKIMTNDQTFESNWDQLCEVYLRQ